MPWHIEDLEARARAITPTYRAHDDPILFGVEAQIALLLAQLDQLRQRHESERREIVHTECDISTDIMKVQDVRYLNFLAKQRAVDGLKTKLLNLDTERRRSQAIHDSEKWRLQERLLLLFIEREHLRP